MVDRVFILPYPLLERRANKVNEVRFVRSFFLSSLTGRFAVTQIHYCDSEGFPPAGHSLLQMRGRFFVSFLLNLRVNLQPEGWVFLLGKAQFSTPQMFL